MDWPRAKSILIIAFLVLNLGLALQLYLLPRLDLSARPVSQEAIERVLMRNEVLLAGELPRRGPTAPFALLSPPAYSDREITAIARDLLGPQAKQVEPATIPSADRSISYSGALGELVVVTAKGFISYQNQIAPDPAANPLTAEDAVRKASAFVRERIGTAGFAYDGVTALTPSGFRVDYIQNFRGSFVFPGYITLVVKPEGIVAMWMYRLRVAFETRTDRRILSAAEAVLSLSNHRQNAGETGGLTVQQVDFGFHSPVYDTVDPTWRGVPVWRILTSRGEFFINAHSGVLETK